MTDPTDEQLRVRIAEACGWRCIDEDPEYGKLWWVAPNGQTYPGVPDYPRDLNAMADARKTLTDDQWTDYLNHLYHITFKPAALDRDRQAVDATARQHALAFVRTVEGSAV